MDMLKDKYTPSQINVMMRKNQTHSKKLSNSDLYKSMGVRMLGGGKMLDHLRKECNFPVACKRTLQDKFSHIRIEPGVICEHTLDALKHAMKSWTSTEFLAMLCFDEVNTTQIGELDLRTDAVIGPHKNGNLVMIRGLTHDWVYPIFLEFDVGLSKANYNKILLAVEGIGIHLLLTCCDQGKMLILARKLLLIELRVKQKFVKCLHSSYIEQNFHI